jgi:hypothetical protein
VVADHPGDVPPLRWRELPGDIRWALTGKLVNLWGAPSDEAAFDSLTIDKQQALLLILERLRERKLWDTVKRIENIYGEGGVGIRFTAWPVLQSRLLRRRDFTRLLANHKDTSGGFYEKGRAEGILHFLFQEGNPRSWYVHFDLYSPVHSLGSATRHLRYEVIRKVRPDWKMIRECLKG